MKKVTIGLSAGLLLCGLAVYVAVPMIQQAAYKNGYNAGDARGLIDGKAAGITQGISEIRAHEQQVRDSIAAEQHKEAALHKQRHKPIRVERPIQNWHVIDGKIADPIPG